ncbi:hypothetical protein OXPF_29840 [Oxobacter pfennigii]|uniref:Uncharacterized protein n=1 Tax=Oxobacter pfennigii TaxID=36849 RepID=A0A0P9AE54_9CLOT|nr:hypothetical protein [Oxobacter pfennigii]KPU43543.1 hypothetical protein OXPF_29840 [Oxobacter pfennigii]
MLKYKKPAFWVVITAVIILVMCIALIINTLMNRTNLIGSNYRVEKVLYDTSLSHTTEKEPDFCITADYRLYTKAALDKAWEYVGKLETYPLTVEELEDYCSYNRGWASKYNVRQIADAYILRIPGDGSQDFYLAIQTGSGDTLLGYGWEDISERGQGASDDTSLQWLFLLVPTLPEHGADADFLDRSLAASVGESVTCFSFYENESAPGYMISGFITDGSTEKSDMGFAVFQFKDRRYKLKDYHLYINAAISKVPQIDSTIHDRIYIADTPAICNASGEATGGISFDVILSNNERLTSITRVVDGNQEITNTVGTNPSMTVFRRSTKDPERKIHYQFS